MAAAADAHGGDILDFGLHLGMPLLGVLFNVVAAQAQQDKERVLKRYAELTFAQRGFALKLLACPTVVDPAVSFAAGGCCLVVINPGGDVTVLPGGNRRAFRRRYRSQLLAPLTASSWASLLPRTPGVRLTPGQADQITAAT